MAAIDRSGDDVFVGLELESAAPTDAAVYYEWLLGLSPGSRPGEALARVGVTAVRGQTAPDAPTGWTPAFLVDDAARAVMRAQQLGGLAEQDADGRWIVHDPAGVRCRLVEAVPPEIAGRHANVDYSAFDVEETEAFYRAVFDARRLRMVDDPYDMRFLCRGRRIAAGVFRLHGVAGFAVRPCWIVYFEVADLVMHVARAAESGSRVLIPPTRSPFNLYAVLEDPWGDLFAFSQLLPRPLLGSLPVTDDDDAPGELIDHVDLFPAHHGSIA
ncbi:VOC family protein [Agromyces bracchium]|uniref:VOC domain-containing protein n=1 Tax=Agromyces bracchium TaxID=88376 RepID=A0A6I3M9H4_9MICO|nr:VOC family protein [Agromyces bracchium]MTH69438.1 hypothetical protein [Agromyces bracchium]